MKTKTTGWDTSKATLTIRALQAENRAMRRALINCNVQAATNADQCDDCEYVMAISGRAIPMPPPRKRRSKTT